MAAITTAAAGNWSATGTWTGGVVPGNGDTVTINHAVTVDVDTTVGTSPATGVVCRVNLAGSLTVATGVTLTLRGDLWLYGPANFSAGSTILFDSTAATAPSTSLYAVYLLGGKASFNGTSGSRVTVGNVSGSAKGRFTGNTGNGDIVASYCDFNEIAGSSYFIQSAKVVSGASLSFTGCTFDGCGKIDYSDVHASGLVKFKDSTFKNSPSGSFLRLYCNSPSATMLRIFDSTVFDENMNVLVYTSLEDFRMDGCLFEGGLVTSGTGAIESFSENMCVQKTAAAYIVQIGNEANISDSYFYLKGANHALHVAHANSTVTVDGCVFELGTDTGGADAILYASGEDDTGAELQINSCIAIPRPGNKSYGTLFNSAFGGKNLVTSITHNTACGNIVAFERVGPTVDMGRAGAISNVDCNIFYNPVTNDDKCYNLIGVSNSNYGISSGAVTSASASSVTCSVSYSNNIFNGHKIKILTGTGAGQVRGVGANTGGALTISPNWATIPDATSTYVIFVPDAIGTARTNCGHGISSGTCYDAEGANPYATSGYDGYALTAPIGTTDISANPNFADPTVTVATWDASLGGAGTVANALAKMRKMNDADYDPDYNISNLLSYIRAGFTPTNSDLLTAGYDGGYIGAVQPVNPDDTAPNLSLQSCTATSPTTAIASVSTDDGNGTLYFLASENATESAATVKAALSQSVTTAGAQSISLSALNPGTTYYVHFVQINGAMLESASVVSTAAFTTDAIAVKGATITLYAGTTPQASLADIVALWWDATTPSGAPDYSTTTASTDSSGVLTLDLDATTALSIGDNGFLMLYKLDATDHRDSLVFAGRVAVSDIA